MTKSQMYHKGWYRFPMCETVAHLKTAQQWIDFIDQCGEWLPNQGKIPFFMPEWLRKNGVTLKDDEHYDAGTMLERSNHGRLC